MQLLDGQQGTAVIRPAAQRGHHRVVTAIFAFVADPTREPPHGGMVEEERLDQDLEQIHRVVVAANMRQLVGQDQFQMRFRQAGDHTQRQKYDRTKVAYHHRRLDQGRLEHLDRSAQREPAGRPFEHLTDGVANG